MKQILFSLLCFTLLSSFAVNEEAILKFKEGNKKIAIRHYREAIGFYNEALALDSSIKEAYKNRGICYSLLAEHENAIHDFNSAIAYSDKDDVALYSYRGFAHAELGDYDKGMVDINKAIELDETFEEAYLNRGIIFLWKEDYSNALNDFNHVIELNNTNAKAYYNRGIAFEELDNIAAACLDFRRAKKLSFPLAMKMAEKYCDF